MRDGIRPDCRVATKMIILRSHDGITTLTARPEPHGRRVHIDIAIVGQPVVGFTLDPSMAHDLMGALRSIAQRRIPDDTEDGSPDVDDINYWNGFGNGA